MGQRAASRRWAPYVGGGAHLGDAHAREGLGGVLAHVDEREVEVGLPQPGVGQRDQRLVVAVDELGLVLASPAHLEHALEHAQEVLHVDRLLVDARRALARRALVPGRGRPPRGHGGLAQLMVLLAQLLELLLEGGRLLLARLLHHLLEELLLQRLLEEAHPAVRAARTRLAATARARLAAARCARRVARLADAARLAAAEGGRGPSRLAQPRRLLAQLLGRPLLRVPRLVRGRRPAQRRRVGDRARLRALEVPLQLDDLRLERRDVVRQLGRGLHAHDLARSLEWRQALLGVVTDKKPGAVGSRDG